MGRTYAITYKDIANYMLMPLHLRSSALSAEGFPHAHSGPFSPAGCVTGVTPPLPPAHPSDATRHQHCLGRSAPELRCVKEGTERNN